MGADYRSYAIIGLQIDPGALYTQKTIKAFAHNHPESMKFDPQTGKLGSLAANVALLDAAAQTFTGNTTMIGSLTLGGSLGTRAATGANVAGTNLTHAAGQGTGTGVGGSHIFQVAPAGGTGSSVNSLVTALTIDSTKLATFAAGINVAGSVSASVTDGEHLFKANWGGNNVLAVQAGSDLTDLPNGATCAAVRCLWKNGLEHAAFGNVEGFGTYVESSDLNGGAPPPVFILQTGVPTGSGLSATQRQRTVYYSDGTVMHNAVNGIVMILQYGPLVSSNLVCQAYNSYFQNNTSGAVSINVANGNSAGFSTSIIRNDVFKQVIFQCYGSTAGGTPLLSGVTGSNLGAMVHTCDNFIIGSYLDTPLIFTRNGSEIWRIDSTTSITYAEGVNVKTGTTTGTKIGTATTQKIGLYGVTPVVQPSTTGTTTGFTAGAGTAVKDDSTFTGGTGSTAYRISDIVKALKQLGVLAV